jgi:hypothetical protein
MSIHGKNLQKKLVPQAETIQFARQIGLRHVTQAILLKSMPGQARIGDDASEGLNPLA